jgi:inhibitor of cysteine peptidase
MIHIDEAANGRELQVPLGESFEVRLPENPTTGYRWRLTSPGGGAVEVEEDTFQRSGGGPGAGDTRCWRLRTVQEGVAVLELDYRRGWEEKAGQTFRVTVRVTPR